MQPSAATTQAVAIQLKGWGREGLAEVASVPHIRA